MALPRCGGHLLILFACLVRDVIPTVLLAGFEVIIYGRFWVVTEGLPASIGSRFRRSV